MDDELLILDSWCDDDDEDAKLKAGICYRGRKRNDLDIECAEWMQMVLDLAEEGYWEE